MCGIKIKLFSRNVKAERYWKLEQTELFSHIFDENVLKNYEGCGFCEQYKLDNIHLLDLKYGCSNVVITRLSLEIILVYYE